jgi:hypothetical protein
MHKYLKMGLLIVGGYTVIASFYNNGKTAGLLPNPIGNLVGFT